MKNSTCTSKDGITACTPATDSSAGCGCSSNSTSHAQPSLKKTNNTLQQIILVAVACLFSPCCVPLIAPIILGLLAGTPLALWLSANIGVLYGILTLISGVSVLLWWRTAHQKSSSRRQLQVSAKAGLKEP